MYGNGDAQLRCTSRRHSSTPSRLCVVMACNMHPEDLSSAGACKKSRNADPGVRVQVSSALHALQVASCPISRTPIFTGRQNILQQDRHHMSPGKPCCPEHAAVAYRSTDGALEHSFGKFSVVRRLWRTSANALPATSSSAQNV